MSKRIRFVQPASSIRVPNNTPLEDRFTIWVDKVKDMKAARKDINDKRKRERDAYDAMTVAQRAIRSRQIRTKVEKYLEITGKL